MEYRIYLPAVFLALLIASLVWPADASPPGGRRGRWRTAWRAPRCWASLVLGFAGLLQAPAAYRTPLAFWRHGRQGAPASRARSTTWRWSRCARAGWRRRSPASGGVLELEPDNTDALLQLGEYRARPGRLRRRPDLYEQVLSLPAPGRAPSPTASPTWPSRPANTTGVAALLAQFPDVSKDAEYYLNLAIYFSRTGQLDRAAAMYRHVLDLEPHNPVAWTNLGNVYRRSARPAPAEACYARALSLEPNYYLAHYNLALLQAERGQLDLARDSLNTVLAVNPEFAAAELELGNVLASGRRYAQAEGHYRRFLERQPNHAVAWRRLGLVLEELGRTDEAAQCRERAERLGESPPAH